MAPSKIGVNYLLPIFTNAIGHDDMEVHRLSLFDSGNLSHAYHSPNIDINRRIQLLDS